MGHLDRLLPKDGTPWLAQGPNNTRFTITHTQWATWQGHLDRLLPKDGTSWLTQGPNYTQDSLPERERHQIRDCTMCTLCSVCKYRATFVCHLYGRLLQKFFFLWSLNSNTLGRMQGLRYCHRSKIPERLTAQSWPARCSITTFAELLYHITDYRGGNVFFHYVISRVFHTFNSLWTS